MDERRGEQRHRALRSGKIIFNDHRSIIDCVVRNTSDGGACLQVASTVGMPKYFDLLLDGERSGRPSEMIWASENRVGMTFCDAQSGESASDQQSQDEPKPGSPESTETVADNHAHVDGTVLRGDFLALHAALDEVPVGIVLLDSKSRAQFINRAYRRMWRLPDAKADAKPPFVALLYHGRDTRAYAVPADELDEYVAERVALVRAGDTRPLDLRLANGEVVRLQCTVLPAGGRLLCYTYVSDIVRHADELEMLQAALDNVQQGVVLLDPFLNAQFMNRAARELWKVSHEQAERKLPYVEFVTNAGKNGAYDVPADAMAKFISERIATVRAGDPAPFDIPHGDGRTIRSQCAILPAGGRMVTYTDVTDLVRRADALEELAIVDELTGLFNRRHFNVLGEAEWLRFQRNHHPLSLLVLDVDHLKSINDRFGREAGDRAVAHIAAVCKEDRRGTNIIARIGGDEFAMLLPEADLQQARVVAERIRSKVASRPLSSGAEPADTTAVTVSIGIAEATAGMPGFIALMTLADRALDKAKLAGQNCTAFVDDHAMSESRPAAE